MKQLQIIDGALRLCEVPILKPGPQQILVKVEAIGVNRADVLQVTGLYPSPDGSNVPGLEIAGYDVDSGSRIAALLPSGGYSQYVLADRQLTFKLPDWLDFSTAAALPEALCTSYMALIEKGSLTQSHNPLVVVHGGSSGIGDMLCQVAKIYGAEVITTVGSATKLSFCHNNGIADAYLYQEQTWVEETKKKGGASLVIDILGGPYLANNVKALRYGGKIVVLAVMNGSSGELPLSSLLMKNASIIGTTLRSQDEETKGRYISQISDIIAHIKDGLIQVHIDSTFSITDVDKAHARMNSREHCGKIVLLADW
ncbi:MAG: zinc-binding dehydrogenase [Proteobacteria bacterium]|nr:zinc-binding dehydrogenase [Pseudomonadota bacterium]